MSLNQPFLESVRENEMEVGSPVTTTQRPKNRLLSKPWFRCGLGCFLVAGVLCSVLLPVGIYVIAPDLAESALKNSAVILMYANMSNPTENSIVLLSSLEMVPSGILLPATIKATEVDVSDDGGNVFGRLQLPSIDAQGSKFVVNMSTIMTITDANAFRTTTGQILSGVPQAWHLSGNPQVQVSGTNFQWQVKFSNSLTLPESQLTEMRAFGLSVISTNSTTLTAKSSASFFSTSVLQLLEMGQMEFEISTSNSSGPLGKVVIPNFTTKKGFNLIDDAYVYLINNNNNTNSVRELLSQVSLGNDITIQFSGPKNNKSPFLNDLVSIDVEMQGESLVTDTQALSMKITNLDENTIYASSVVTFYSEMALSINALGGNIYFEFLFGENMTKIGEALLTNDIIVGKNYVENVTTTLFIDNSNNNDNNDLERIAIYEFLSNFSLGNSQEVIMRGPIRHINPFVNNMFSRKAIVSGMSMLGNVVASDFTIVSSNSTSVKTIATVSFSSSFPLSIESVGGSLTFELRNKDNILIGLSTINVDINKGYNVIQNATTILIIDSSNNGTITNIEAIRQFLSVMSSGQDQSIIMYGPVNSVCPLMNGIISQEAIAKGSILMTNAVGSDIVVTGGEGNNLFSYFTSSFYTDIEIQENGLGGPVTFEISLKGQVIGTAVINSAIQKGLNVINTTSVLTLTNENTVSFREFNSNFLNGFDQKVQFSGPIGMVAPFVDHIVTITATVKGLSTRLVTFSQITEKTLGGIIVGTELLRGTKLTIFNPFPITLIQSGMNVHITLQTPISYNFSHPILGKHVCKSTEDFSVQITRAGMYENNVTQDYVVALPQTYTTFFSPSVPADSQKNGDNCIGLPCCFLTVPIAGSCRALTLSDDFVKLTASGVIDVTIGTLKFTVDTYQKDVQLLFDPSVTAGFLFDAEINCSDYTFQ